MGGEAFPGTDEQGETADSIAQRILGTWRSHIQSAIRHRDGFKSWRDQFIKDFKYRNRLLAASKGITESWAPHDFDEALAGAIRGNRDPKVKGSEAGERETSQRCQQNWQGRSWSPRGHLPTTRRPFLSLGH